MDNFENAFWSGQSIEELYRTTSAKQVDSMPALFVAAMREWKRSVDSQARSFAGLQTRIEKVMDVTITREVDRLERGLVVLATAMGLVAAIPATLFYNKFISEVNRQSQQLQGFADEFSAILSRQIDERA